MGEPVNEKEAELFAHLLQKAMDEWLERTGRDEIPDVLARKVLERMDEE